MDIDSSTTADEVLNASQENDRWECKSAALLNHDQRERLAKHLGKQVSAFANSGGGFLVFGISDSPRQLEACADFENKTPMKDWLSTKVNECVEYPVRTYQIHRIPFADDNSKAIYVITIRDSPAAPHQAKEDRHYYYRIDGHTKPAPHFYVELLRNRETKAMLSITQTHCHVNGRQFDGEKASVTMKVVVTVENQSHQAATTWGATLKRPKDSNHWIQQKTNRVVADGICVHGEQPVLLPNESSEVFFHLTCSRNAPHFFKEEAIYGILKHLNMTACAVSQNFASTDYPIALSTDDDISAAMSSMGHVPKPA